jgi:hypothetical protein
VVLYGLGVVLVGEYDWLVMGVLGKVGLTILRVPSEAFLLELLVVKTFCDMCTS